MPRLVIAGVAGDTGKTLVSLSLAAALQRRKLVLSTFKKGPDYIDAAWLTYVSGVACRNLDTYLVASDEAYRSFVLHARHSEFALIEGNRGLYDGKDVVGTHSTAELAKLLKAPVVLVVDVTKVTRTVAAIINGCVAFDPQVRIAGVILNSVAGPRHEEIITNAVKRFCRLPVVGVIPKLGKEASLIPGRHLGLVPPSEFDTSTQFVSRLAELADKYLDIDALIRLAAEAPPLDVLENEKEKKKTAEVKIGYFKDSVFTFYYPENLEALEQNGAELVPIDSLHDNELPAVDALYIGGGFPETHASRLAANRRLLEDIKCRADAGLPIYAECGGLIMLSRSLRIENRTYPMAGVFPVEVVWRKKPAGHGYTHLRVEKDNPYFQVGSEMKGHEFHYTGVEAGGEEVETCLTMLTGTGVGGKQDGLIYRRVLAAYTHIHASGVTEWAAALVAQAREYRSQRDAEGKESLSEGEMRRLGPNVKALTPKQAAAG